MFDNRFITLKKFYEAAEKDCLDQISHILHDKIPSIRDEAFLPYILERYGLPLVREDEVPTYETKVVQKHYHDGGRNTPVEYEVMIVSVPVCGDQELGRMLALRSGNEGRDPNLPDYTFDGRCISFQLEIGIVEEISKPHVLERAKLKLDEALRAVREDFKRRNQIIQAGHDQLVAKVAQAIKKRKLEQSGRQTGLDQLRDKLQIPLRKRSELPPHIVIVPSPKTMGGARPIEPSSVRQDRVLDPKGFQECLNYLVRYIHDCERTPDTFRKLGEEEVRNLLLPYLNQVFEGGASGETFSKRGKTDLYLVIEKGCILICECKWWRGPKSLEEVSSQILDRLTWRENFGIALIFVREDFSRVIAAAKESLARLPSNVNQTVKEVSEGHYLTVSSFPEDKEKRAELHFIFVNFSSKVSVN